MPLAVFTAAAVARLYALGLRVAGVPIALLGGQLAAGSLALAALVQWVLRDAGRDLPVAAVGVRSGCPGVVVPLGLLPAGHSVSSPLAGLLRRPTAPTGLALAGLAEQSPLAPIWPAAGVLLPAARFPALVWLIVVAVQLPHRRQPRTAAAGAHPSALVSRVGSDFAVCG